MFKLTKCVIMNKTHSNNNVSVNCEYIYKYMIMNHICTVLYVFCRLDCGSNWGWVASRGQQLLVEQGGGHVGGSTSINKRVNSFLSLLTSRMWRIKHVVSDCGGQRDRGGQGRTREDQRRTEGERGVREQEGGWRVSAAHTGESSFLKRTQFGPFPR